MNRYQHTQNNSTATTMKFLSLAIALIALESAIFLPSSFAQYGTPGDAPPPKPVFQQVAPIYNQVDVCTDFCKGALTTCQGVVDWVTNTYAVPTTRHIEGGTGTSITRTGEPYEQYDACHKTCMGWVYWRQEPAVTGATRFFNGYSVGDSLNCRYNHLQFASGIPSNPYGLKASESESGAEHCAHITQDGGWVCTDYRNEDNKTPGQLYMNSILRHKMGDCFLAADDKIADCHRTGMTDANVDQNLLWLPDDIEYIFLNANSFTKIPDLSRFKSLKGIYLENNAIETLESDDFASNTELEIINLSNNFITEYPADFFSNLTKLKAFYALFNYVEKIPDKLFSKNNEIEMIAVVGNKLEGFEAGTFDGLSKLKLLAFGGQGKASFDGRIFTEDGIPDGLFDDLVSLEYMSWFIHSIGRIKSTWFGDWSAKVENIVGFIYKGNNPPVVVEEGVFEKLPNLINFASYTAGNVVNPTDVATNTKLRSITFGNQGDINQPLPFSGLFPKPELIPPSSTPTPAPITPTSAAPSDAPTDVVELCEDDKGPKKKYEIYTGKKESLTCEKIAEKNYCNKKLVKSKNKTAVKHKCKKTCGVCQQK